MELGYLVLRGPAKPDPAVGLFAIGVTGGKAPSSLRFAGALQEGAARILIALGWTSPL
jgi:hypothetical protein